MFYQIVIGELSKDIELILNAGLVSYYRERDVCIIARYGVSKTTLRKIFKKHIE